MRASVETKWLRSREQSIVLAVGGAVFALLSIGEGLTEADMTDRLVWCAAAAFFVAISVRLAMMGARPEHDGIRVRNLVWTRLIPWGEVRQFRVGDRGVLRRVAIADLVDGRTKTIAGIAGPPFSTRPRSRTAEDLVDHLNGLLNATRDGMGPSG
jgi:Bacterial PH domain